MTLQAVGHQRPSLSLPLRRYLGRQAPPFLVVTPTLGVRLCQTPGEDHGASRQHACERDGDQMVPSRGPIEPTCSSNDQQQEQQRTGSAQSNPETGSPRGAKERFLYRVGEECQAEQIEGQGGNGVD